MGRLRRIAGALGAHAGIAAIACLGLAWGLQMHSIGWAQSAFFAQTRALAEGRAEIDRWHWETKDKAWVDGHFYSVKAPGVAALATPAYLALDAAGGDELSREMAAAARRSDHPRWVPQAEPPYPEHGFSAARAARVERRVEQTAPLVWMLALLVAVVPAVALLACVRWVGERIEPGYGTAAAVTLGAGSIVMTFAAELFAHVIAALLAFAAFALLFRERAGPPRLALVALAGLLAGLAVSFEYPLGLAGAVLFAYAALRPAAPAGRGAERLRRGLAFTGAGLAGAAPALAYNAWSLGSPLRFAYGDAVASQGASGHAELGLNDDGLFGITLPKLDSALDLLLAGRGLVTLTPVLLMGLVGLVLAHRRGHRAEALAAGAIAALYFVYNAGYWLPFGGGTPGARFLMPALPFIALGLACSWRRFPATTLVLAIPSAVFMLAAALTFPLIGENGTALWAERLWSGELEHTVLTALGVRESWLAALPVLAALAAAVAFAVRATPRPEVGDLRLALGAVLAWAAASAFGPSLVGDAVTPLGAGRGGEALQLVALGAGLSLLSLAALALAPASRSRLPRGARA